MRQFISSLPDELIDAARVDGCRELAIFWKIILPLTKPALATLGIITFLGSWNNFLWPWSWPRTKASTHSPSASPWPAADRTSPASASSSPSSVVVLLPVMIIFLLFQRHFVAGIATTGLK